MVGDMSANHEGRAPLDAAALQADLVRPGRLWREITVVGTTGSTNADLAVRAAQGAPEGTVLAAEEQLAGRGRMGRQWVSPARSAVMVSVLLRPAAIAPARRGWLPLLAGVAAATAVRQSAGVPAVLKWPNDVLVGERKLAGILAEQSGDAVVVGLGLNVSATEAGAPGHRAGGARRDVPAAGRRHRAGPHHPAGRPAGRIRTPVPGLGPDRPARRPGGERAAGRLPGALHHRGPGGTGGTGRRPIGHRPRHRPRLRRAAGHRRPGGLRSRQRR